MLKLSPRVRILITLLLAAGLLAWLVSRPATTDVQRIGFQEDASPLRMPDGGEVDHRFDFPSAWELAQIPMARDFESPMGRMIYNAQKFWEMNPERGGHHSGDDLNGIGGQDSDLGDPVFSVADGLVIYAAEPSPDWGKVMVIAHRLGDGRVLHSMYAHLHRFDVASGTLVARGQPIGTVGTANGNYLAHLHFEMRESDFLDLGRGYLMDKLNRLDPMGTVASLSGAASKGGFPSPLAVALKDKDEAWTRIRMKRADLFSNLKEQP